MTPPALRTGERAGKKPMCQQCEELWRDGVPVSLPAAALDALEWLEWLQDYASRARVFSQPDSQQRLGRAIQALKGELEGKVPEDFLKKCA